MWLYEVIVLYFNDFQKKNQQDIEKINKQKKKLKIRGDSQVGVTK